MTFSKIEFQDTITFIKAYRAMEMATVAANHKLIKKVVDRDKAKHLCGSWSGRDNDFGSFFLNLSYKTQAKFLLNWNVRLTGYEDFLTELHSHPHADAFATPPVEVSKLHHLQVFFNNYSVEDTTGIKLPAKATDRYGNSANWGKYILSLNEENQYSVLLQITEFNVKSILQSEENRKFMAKSITGTNG